MSCAFNVFYDEITRKGEYVKYTMALGAIKEKLTIKKNTFIAHETCLKLKNFK